MNDFNPLHDYHNTQPNDYQPKGMIGWLVNHSGGIIKNGQQASVVLVLVSLLFLAASFFIFFGVGNYEDSNVEIDGTAFEDAGIEY